MKTLITILLVLALVPGLAVAGPWTAGDIVLSGTAGSGSNASYLVLDFGSAAYAFEYLWDTGTPYGFDMLTALSAEGGIDGLSFAYHIETGLGAMVDTISYGTHSGTSDYPRPFWNYWTGPAGGPITYSWLGATLSPLADGSVDAWIFTADYEQPPIIPGVPEPSALLALGSLIGLVGSVGLLRGRRK